MSCINPVAKKGFPDIDKCLAHLPQAFEDAGFKYEQRKGYKAWKVPGFKDNWFQWNDGDIPLRIRFGNRRHEVKTWKLFARFGTKQSPRWPWDQPEEYKRKKAQWMLGGADVWGCAYEDLRSYLGQFTSQQILERLKEDLSLSFEYSIQKWRRR